MSDTSVDMYVSLGVPAAAARGALASVIADLRAHVEPYRDLEFAFTLPMAIEIEEHPQRWQCSLHVRARRNERFFPTFDGLLSISPVGEDACELWLQGAYSPPAGRLGQAIDATVLDGIAKTTLRHFLQTVADGVGNAATGKPRTPEAQG